MHDIIIIGGGAAGLFLAANIKNKNVLLLEKMKVPGKKMLLSGGGMCNLTNLDPTGEFITHFGDRKKSNFLKPALSNLSTEETRTWFKDSGFALVIRDDGKVFPSTLKAKSLVDHLIRMAGNNGVQIKTSEEILEIKKEEDHFSVTSANQVYKSKKVVISCGGKSYESTGSDGSGYELAKTLGHKLIEPTQALAAVNISEYLFKVLAGNSIRKSSVDFFRENEDKRYHQSNGDLLFTHKGISGPVILNNSRYINKNDLLKVSLISTENKEQSRIDILDAIGREPKKQLSTILKSYGIFSGLSDILFSILEMDKDITCARLSKKDRNKLTHLLLDFPFRVSRKGYFSSAMVTAGGIDLNQINRKTMESKIVENLYFAGEVIDIDGDTGGYNIQAAFSMAYLIAKVFA